MYCAPHNGKMENDRNNLEVQLCVSAMITTLHSLKEIDFFLIVLLDELTESTIDPP